MSEGEAASRRLEVRNLEVQRGGRSCLHPLSFELGAGECMAVLGPNGAGKSTLLRAILALQPHQGSVRVEGRELARLEASERARLLAYLPQRSLLDAPLSVRSVVAQGRFAHASSARGEASRQGVEAALRLLDLSPLAERAFTRLSYGEQRRVLLARALATEAPLLLLDEPSAALDLEQSLRLFATLEGFCRRGGSVLVVLHDLNEACRWAQRVLVLHRGQLVAQGAPDAVLHAQTLAEVWQVGVQPNAALAFHLPGSRP